MKAKTDNGFRYSGNANSGVNFTVFSKKSIPDLQGNQGFVVPWQMADKRFAGKYGEQLRG